MKKKDNKTIAIFSGYHLPHLGGIERYTDNLSKQLILNDYNIVIISSNYRNDKEYIKETDNIDYYKVPIYNIFVNRYPIPKKNAEYKEILNNLKKYNIEAIIVNTRFHLTSLLGAKYGHKNKIPVFLVEHGSQHLTVDNKILDFFGEIYEHILTKIVKKNVDYYYGVSYEACKWQKHFGIDSNGVWYNSIEDFSKNIKLSKNKNGIINILYAGRILRQKGIIELLDSFTKLEKKYTNIHLTIAGDGNLLPLIKEKYKSKNITFLGKIDFKRLKAIYAITDIFVYAPNWPEGLPTSILEAGLMKCAVIASPQGGIKEIISDRKNGIMINEKIELLKALEELIKKDNFRKELANNLQKDIKEKFLWKSTAKKVINDIEKEKQ